MKTPSRFAPANIVLAKGGLLAGCTDAITGDMPSMSHPPSSPTSDVSTKHNPRDVMCAQVAVVPHQGAILMAQEQLSKGNDQAAKKLAENTVTSQNTETSEMPAIRGSSN